MLFVVSPAYFITRSKIVVESKYVAHFSLSWKWMTLLATGLHARHPCSCQVLTPILISLVKFYCPSMSSFLPPLFHQYNHLYRKATKSCPPVPGSPDFSKLEAMTMSYVSTFLILRMFLTPPSAQARWIWHLSAANLTLGDYTLSISTFPECFPVNWPMKRLPTWPLYTLQPKWIIISTGQSYPFLLL